MNEKIRTIIAYSIICTIWGSSWFAIKIMLQTVPPLLGAGLRFALSSIILFFLIRTKGISIPWNKKLRSFYFLISLTSLCIPFALVYWGEQYVPSGLAAILFATYPFAVALFSYFLLPNEKITAPKILGIAIAFLGICIIFGNDIGVNSSKAILGMAAIITSAVLQALSAIIIKKHGQEISPFVILFLPAAYAAVLLLVASAILENHSTTNFTTPSIISILYLAIFATVITFVSYYWLLKRVQPVILSLTAFITPIVAVILGVTIANEKFSLQIYAGAIFVLGGIIIANMYGIKKTKDR